jgi:FMN phosphatase YigB (HAD superfamily)
MARVHSFDVFDTSLIRKVAAPTDVFRLLASNIAQKISIFDKSEFAEDFVSARIRAEQEAKAYCEETTIEKIWINLRALLPELPVTVGPQDELDVEEKLLLPNAPVVQRIETLRSSNGRIVFTSDTYLPEAFVRAQLLRHGVAEEGDGIYVSSAAGVTKRHGGLFDVVLKREGVSARELHHHGDNTYNDIVMPRRFGIEATSLACPLNTWERSILSKDVRLRLSASLLAGSMRAFRLSSSSQLKSGAGELVATLLAPALLVWAAWILGRALQDGVRRLYFVSRQGYLLCRAARILAPHFGNIDCRDLLVSRKSILLPSTEEISQSGMPWLRRSRPTSIGEVIQKLDLDWSVMAPYFSSLAKGKGEFSLLTCESDWTEFWKILTCTPVKALLLKKIQAKREIVLGFLRAEGLCDDVPVGIVDIGWYMTVQTRLQKLLSPERVSPNLRGYFLGLCQNRMPPADAGKVTALFYQQAFDHRTISPEYEIFRRIDVFDHVFGLAPHGSVSGYEVTGSGVEVICPSESAVHKDLVHKLEQAVETFCKNNQGDVLRYCDSVTARELIDGLFHAWCVRPNTVALETLGHVIVTDGTDGVPSQPLLQSWSVLDAVKTLIPGRWRQGLKIRIPSPVWPEAAFSRSSITAQLVLRLAKILRILVRRLLRRPTAYD